jgi:hypothetical protein
MLDVHLPSLNPDEGKWITSSEQEEDTVHSARDEKFSHAMHKQAQGVIKNTDHFSLTYHITVN